MKKKPLKPIDFGKLLESYAYHIVKKSEKASLLRRNDGKQWMVETEKMSYIFENENTALQKFNSIKN